MVRSAFACAMAVGLLAAQTPCQGAGESKLYVRGRPVSTNVRMIGGKPYASLDEVARALGMTVIKKSDGYELTAPGGANQIAARTGKLGEEVFTGDWRFQVLGVKQVSEHTPAYRDDRSAVRPKGAGDVLVVVTCRVKNGHKVRELLNFQNQFSSGQDHTALTDDRARSYPPHYYDVHHDYYSYGAYALPGAAIDFALVFSVPRGTKAKDLVFSIYRYEDRGDPKKQTDVRVRLTGGG